MSPYNYAAGNPVSYVDILGSEIGIHVYSSTDNPYDDVTLKYDVANKSLFNPDGSKYSGNRNELSEFNQHRLDELDLLYTVEHGKKWIDELQDSKNMFEFLDGTQLGGKENCFVADDENSSNGIGGGGKIVINETLKPALPELGGGMYYRPVIVTGHEGLGHGIDANRGISNRDWEYSPFTASPGKLPIDEWRASYRENILREELKKLPDSIKEKWNLQGMGLREYYNLNVGRTGGEKPKIINGSYKIIPESIKGLE